MGPKVQKNLVRNSRPLREKFTADLIYNVVYEWVGYKVQSDFGFAFLKNSHSLNYPGEREIEQSP